MTDAKKALDRLATEYAANAEAESAEFGRSLCRVDLEYAFRAGYRHGLDSARVAVAILGADVTR